MFHILMVLLILLLSVGASTKAADTATTPPAPALTISFERQNIREKDCVNVELLLTNGSDAELSKMSLTVAGPAFIAWHTNSCGKDAKETPATFGSPSMPLDLGAVAPRSTLRRQVHLHTDPTVEVGDYNSLFTVEYHWKLNNVIGSSFVSSEKPIKVSFLGNESVAGIPLALAGFIVPGLVFWWVIKLFGASWSVDALSQQMIYSVLVSILLVFIGTLLRFSDISTGISTKRLLYLALAGLIAGVSVGGVDLFIRKVRARQAANKAAAAVREAAELEAARLEREIRPEESLASLLGKLLELPPQSQLTKPLIRLKNQQQYVGALAARTYFTEPGSSKTELVSVVGSFFIDSSAADETLKARLKELRDAGQMRALVTLAEENNLLTAIEGVQKVNEEGEFEPSGKPFMLWEGKDVESVEIDQEGWEQPPLR